MTRLAGGFRRAGMRLIWGGRASVRAALYRGALVATRYKPLIQRFDDRLGAAGQPQKLALTACMRQLITLSLQCAGAIQLGVAARSRVVHPRTGLTPETVAPKQ